MRICVLLAPFFLLSCKPEPQEMLLVTYVVFETDRQCWSVREVERPAEYWRPYYQNQCDEVLDNQARDRSRIVTISEPEGEHCGHFEGLAKPGCLPDDSSWLLDCEVGGCCELDINDAPYCNPFQYEP